MKKLISCIWMIGLLTVCLLASCSVERQDENQAKSELTAKDILGNPAYKAMAYGGYRHNTRDVQPTVEELKEDMRILHAMGIRLVRTYNVHLEHASNLLKAISELNASDDTFEMYVMLGAWINCEGAFTAAPNHDGEDEVMNAAEIAETIRLARLYPDIVKCISVGNEAMVHWATSYYVKPGVILKYVNQLQELKRSGELPSDLWITSSDNFAAWGGLEASWTGKPYRIEGLEALIEAVDFIALHTYSFHHSHYTPEYWGVLRSEEELSDREKIEAVMDRSIDVARMEYQAVVDYVESLGADKPIHIGEAGWSSMSNGFYGGEGTRAADEFKQAFFYDHMRQWTTADKISCFLFEAFDEPWKSGDNPGGSENHFGLFTVDGQAKYVIWDLVDEGVFDGLTRNGNPITKTYDGNFDRMMEDVGMPPYHDEEFGHTTAQTDA